MENNLAQKILLNNCFSITMNCNDFFAYACADETVINEMDFDWVYPIVEEYGSDGINAVCSYIRSLTPIKPWINKKFEEALEKIKALKPEVYSLDYN